MHRLSWNNPRRVVILQRTLGGIVLAALFLFTWMWDTSIRTARNLSLEPAVSSSTVFDATGRLAFSFATDLRFPVPLRDVSSYAIEAVLLAEDRRFYDHPGLDLRRIAGAAAANLRSGRVAQGGSTITQQLVRLLCLDRSRTWRRKLREAFVSLAVERRFSKEDILTAYLNAVYFGNGYYGIEAAARGYYDKPAAALDALESATLAALIRNPSIGDDDASRRVLKWRRDQIVALMKADGVTSGSVEGDADAPLFRRAGAFATLGPAFESPIGAYFKEAVRQELVHRLGAERFERGGLRIFTRFDPAMQRAAERAIEEQVAAIERRTRRGGSSQPLEGALIALEPSTGLVRALVGGRDFRASPFDRARQARRQPGSAFKPLVYAAALEMGYSPGTLLTGLSTPLPLDGGSWLPRGGGDVSTLREGLVASSNRAAVHLLARIGSHSVVSYAHRFGLEDELPNVPSLALGTADVSLLDLTAAYSVFVNGGLRVAPSFVARVEDAHGVEIFRHDGPPTPVVRATTAYLVASMLADVMNRGTGAAARSHGFRLPAGGKTGTSQDVSDAWFVGFTPSLLTGVWIGYDRRQPIAKDGTAGKLAVPAWAAFMREATKGAGSAWLETPSNLRAVVMCRVSGRRATDACRQAVYDYEHPEETQLPLATDLTAPLLDTPEPPPARRPGLYRDLFEMGLEPGPCDVHPQTYDLPETPTYSIPRWPH